MTILSRLKKLEREHERFLRRLEGVEEEAEAVADRLVRIERERAIYLPKPQRKNCSPGH